VATLHLKGSNGGVTIGPRANNTMRDGVPLGLHFDFGVVAVGRVGIVRGGA
jgi:hypothetical protein